MKPIRRRVLAAYLSIKVTVDIYGHFAPGGNRSAIDTLDDAAPVCTLSAPKIEKDLRGRA